MLGIGVFGGLAIGASALFQGRIGAGAADALAETGKGFGNYLMALGIIETVALFVMVFIAGLV
jgi:V/A-type H+-transporting ATPase subunit K